MTPLPIGILKGDLKWTRDIVAKFDLWLVIGMGWVIPCLSIAKATGRRVGRADRTYAVSVTEGKLCRVGFGPHVTEQFTVYVSKGRAKQLQKFLDLHTKGQVDANIVRDCRSSRRAQGQLNRAAGLTHWMW